MVPNNVVWQGSPSQWLNAKPFTIAIFLFLAFLGLNSSGLFDMVLDNFTFLGPWKAMVKTVIFLIPVLMIVWNWLQIKFRNYELTEEVFRESFGVLDRTTHELELYRVNDTMTFKPFELNVMGLGNVVLHTSDASDPTIIIAAIRDPDKVRQMVRHYVELQRQRKGIVEVANR